MLSLFARHPRLVGCLCAGSLLSACGLTDQELAGIFQTSLTAGLTSLLGQVAQAAGAAAT